MKRELESKDIANIVANNLAKVREFQGLTQTQMEEKIGIEQPSYSQSENGIRELNFINLYYLAVEFGIDLNCLFGLSEERINPAARINHSENLKKADKLRRQYGQTPKAK